MYSNVVDTIHCETPEMAEKLFNFLRSEGYSVMQASAEINTGTRGNYAAKQLTIFKPKVEQKYDNVDEMVKDISNVLKIFKDLPCNFDTGCDLVTHIEELTLLNTDDWGVHWDQGNTGNVTIYNEDAEEVITLWAGKDGEAAASVSYSVTRLAELAGLPDPWHEDMKEEEK